MVTFNIVTPAGGNKEELYATVNSIIVATKKKASLDIVNWHVILNNGLKLPKDYFDKFAPNINIFLHDINPVASRSIARNLALNKISKEKKPSWIMFLDSGDFLKPNLFNKISDTDLFPTNELVVGQAIIMQADQNQYLRISLPLMLRYVINPIYLGTTWISSDLAKKVRFHDGAKEDWKFWIEILKTKPKVRFESIVNYVYTISSKSNHIKRKAGLIKAQYAFYCEYLKFSKPVSLVLIALHYTLLIAIWVFSLNIRKIR